jgi:hypothetical protein
MAIEFIELRLSESSPSLARAPVASQEFGDFSDGESRSLE